MTYSSNTITAQTCNGGDAYFVFCEGAHLSCHKCTPVFCERTPSPWQRAHFLSSLPWRLQPWCRFCLRLQQFFQEGTPFWRSTGLSSNECASLSKNLFEQLFGQDCRRALRTMIIRQGQYFQKWFTNHQANPNNTLAPHPLLFWLHNRMKKFV